MDMDTRVYVINDLDVMLARMQARLIAQKMGFNPTDQSRISLAASEMARVLSWQACEPGEMTIANTKKNGHQGLQVWCTVPQEYLAVEPNSNGSVVMSVPYRSFLGACHLVDESTVDAQDDRLVRVTLITWLK
jgi:hypothetical protein